MGDDKKKKIEGEALLGLIKLKREQKELPLRPTSYKYKSEFQKKVLLRVYNITQYPSSATRNDLGMLLNMHPRSVQIWFQNSRKAFKETYENKNNIGSVKGKEKDIPISLLHKFCQEILEDGSK